MSAPQTVSSSGPSITSSMPTPTPRPTASSTSSNSEPQTHTVAAGRGGFKFEPRELTDVAVGDTVVWEFYPLDHSVARAAFEDPCVPIETFHKDTQGFWSDVQWVNTTDDVSAPKRPRMNVN
jgi:plastocyanin